MDSEDIPESTLHKIACNMRREDVVAIALRCMKLPDATMDQLENDYTKDVPFKYNVFIKWAHRDGVTMKDLKELIVQAIKEEIPVERKVRNFLNI